MRLPLKWREGLSVIEREVEEEEDAEIGSNRLLRRKREEEEGGGGLRQVIREVRCWK